jgi:SM-20-related protein
VVVRDGVLPPAATAALRDAAVTLHAAGALRPAGTGPDAGVRPGVRDDAVAWVDDHLDVPVLADLWRWLEALGDEASAAAWLGLRGQTVQLARYGGDGARYARHVDALRHDPLRRLTALLYLNPGWRPPHGGVLRAFEDAGPRDVEPLDGRLVLFLADRVPHEVLPSFAPRWTATAWYRSR